MAQMQADRPWDGPAQGNSITGNSITRVTHVAGSIVSVALVVGLGVWGYKLLVRDVSGVPVIRAAEGPARVQPEDPGGSQADHQGLSVNDVAAIGTAGAAPDELILAPAPLDLSDEDRPATALAAAPAASEQDALPARLDAEVSAPDANVAQADVPAPQSEDEANAAMLALADTLSAGLAPLGEVAPAPEVEIVAPEPVAAPAPAPAPVTGGIGRSLRPKTRPAGLSNVQTVAALAPETAAAQQSGVRDIDAETIPPGTRLAQLGAYKSEDIARSEWARLSGQFEEYLLGKDRVIQRATSGGRTFYRLRAMGFDDLADARRFCSALVAERAECIPVVTR